MTLTKNISYIVKRELAIQWHSKRILFLIVVLLIFCGIHLFGMYSQIVQNYDIYVRTKEFFVEDGFDIVEILREDLTVIYQEDGSFSIDNPLKFDFINLAISIQNLAPKNIVSNTLEYIVFVFGTLIFGIYAGYLATHDFKSKTYKFISIKNPQMAIIIGKLITAVIIKVTTLGFVLIFTFICSFIVKAIIRNHIPIHLFAIDVFNYDYGLTVQLMLTFFVLVLYICIGFSLGFIFKSIIVPTITLFTYGLILPILGAYDLRNIVSHFAHQFFSFRGRFVMFTPIQINSFLGAIIILFTIVFFLALTFLVVKKRSAYD